MQHIIFGFKREYWEHKKLLVMMPILVSALFFLVTIAATWMHEREEDQVASVRTVIKEGSVYHSKTVDEFAAAMEGQRDLSSTSSSEGNKGEDNIAVNDTEQSEDDFWFSGVYLITAWLAALFYASSALFNDRRDKSILYWKTLPVSELQNILIKYGFAILAFSAVAVVVSWLTAMVLISYSHLVFPPEMLAQSVDEMSLTRMVVWPLLAILVSLLWCAPLFALALYASAKASKTPLFLLVIPIIVIKIVENVLFKSDYIFDFLYAHSPFALVADLASMSSGWAFLKVYLLDSFLSLLIGILIAFVLIWRTAWLRDHEFEMV